tara:strand:- start:502 stop:945 length:444 start_codon:yes stop_codon:yes gene_type:complete
MGNSISNSLIIQNSDDYSNLDNEYVSEKSLYSYKIILKETVKKDIKNYEDDCDKLKYINKNKAGISCKLKLYPSCVAFKSDYILDKFSYFDVLCWGATNTIFYFETVDKIFYCILKKIDGYTVSKDIIKICREILEKIKKEKKIALK